MSVCCVCEYICSLYLSDIISNSGQFPNMADLESNKSILDTRC